MVQWYKNSCSIAEVFFWFQVFAYAVPFAEIDFFLQFFT